MDGEEDDLLWQDGEGDDDLLDTDEEQEMNTSTSESEEGDPYDDDVIDMLFASDEEENFCGF